MGCGEGWSRVNQWLDPNQWLKNDVKDFKQTMFALNIQWSLSGVCWFNAEIASAWISGYE